MDLKNNLKNIIQSRGYKIGAIALAAVLALFLVFFAGMRVGFHKAGFSYKWGENYNKNFTGPHGGTLRGAFRDFNGKNFINSYGAAGRILKIDSPTSSGQTDLVIKGDDGVEKIVTVKPDTTIVRLRETAKFSELKINDNISVIGSSTEDGKIEAKFIRIFPAIKL